MPPPERSKLTSLRTSWIITWTNVTKADLHKCLISEFGPRETDESSLLCQFGPNHLKKAPEMYVNAFFHSSQEQLPDCMLPSTDNERSAFIDLVKRSLFYFGLEDKYLQEQLCNLKSDKPSLKMYFDEAVAAESRRRSFEDIGVSSTHLDSSSGVSRSKWEANSQKPRRWDDSGKSGAALGQREEGVSSPQPSFQTPSAHQQDDTQTKGSQVASGTPNTRGRGRKGRCYACQRYGHFAHECRSGSWPQFSQADVMSPPPPSTSATDQTQQEGQAFNVFTVEVVEDGADVHAFATCVGSPLVTNEPMVTNCLVAGVTSVQFECDTAASHSVLSKSTFDKLQSMCQVTLQPERVVIRLADGTLSNKSYVSAQLTVQKSTDSSKIYKVTFFVLDCPNCLLGRYALQMLWPKQYLALKEVAKACISTVHAGAQTCVKKKI